jgi:hypothetical protein
MQVSKLIPELKKGRRHYGGQTKCEFGEFLRHNNADLAEYVWRYFESSIYLPGIRILFQRLKFCLVWVPNHKSRSLL